MTEIFEVAAKITNPYSLAAFALAVILFILSKRRRKPPAIAWISILSIVFVAILAPIFLEIFKPTRSLQLTVYVHGPEGQQHIVLEDTGKLIVDFGNDRRRPKIGENGRTNFGEIPQKFNDQEIGIGLKATGYELADPNKQYKMDGKPIYLAVKKDDSLAKISGIVKNRDGSEFIKDALVMIGNDTTTTTNELGIFKIILPLEMQVKDDKSPYLLTVKKEGYQIKTEYYYPRSSGDIEIRLEKQRSSTQ